MMFLPFLMVLFACLPPGSGNLLVLLKRTIAALLRIKKVCVCLLSENKDGKKISRKTMGCCWTEILLPDQFKSKYRHL